MFFSTFENSVDSAVASRDALFTANHVSNVNGAQALVDAYPTTVMNTRAMTNQVIGGYLGSIQEDAAGVLVWALADELGTEDVCCLNLLHNDNIHILHVLR